MRRFIARLLKLTTAQANHRDYPHARGLAETAISRRKLHAASKKL